jgi:diaminopimelate epimerase
VESKIQFYKYQGTGNDFVMIDNREGVFDPKNHNLIEKMCDRRFGIGGDGLILLQNHDSLDFEMVYFNANGYEGSMCGNGGRCIVAFAKFLGIIEHSTMFMAVDGAHEAKVSGGIVELKMADVNGVEEGEGSYFLDTGSPHFVRFVDNIEGFDVFEAGRKVRYSERFNEVGTNVNFVEELENGIKVATYERGVEDETLSCGTGIVASSITQFLRSKKEGDFETAITAKGGKLKVHFKSSKGGFHDIWLCGPATQTFEGKY